MRGLGSERRFIVDVNVGRLATWLRAMGYDTLFLPDIEDNDLVRIAFKEGRTVVTKDSRLAERRLVTMSKLSLVLIQHDDLKSQLRQVIRALDLSSNGAFSRCLRCNQALAALVKEEAKSRVPVYVFQTQEEFMECPQCRRVYWRGTHWSNMRSDLAQLREESP